MAKSDSHSESGTAVEERTRLKRPSMFKVIMLNDDYTPMDFVVAMLEGIFRKPPSEAVQLMLQVHNQGRAICGVYPREIAEAKVELVHDNAQSSGYPLRCTMEEQ